METESVVQGILAGVLARPIAIGENISRASEPKWDSLKHVEIIYSIEDACSVYFDSEELPSLNDLRSIVDAVNRHRAT